MGRFSKSTSYGHKVQLVGQGHYRLHWTVDRYVAGQRGRHPTGYRRDTDEAGALRFAKKWDIVLPKAEKGKP